MRRIALLLVAACLLSGCGVLTQEQLKPQAQTLTHGRFVYLANRACARNERRQKQIGRKKPKSAPAVSRQLQVSLNAIGHLIFVLRGLVPPPAAAVDFRRLMATANDEELVATHLLEAFNEGQVEGVKARVRRFRALDRRFDARAAKLGLSVCAKP